MPRGIDNPKLLFNTLLRKDFGAFLRKAYPTIHGGEPLMWNWHLAALVYYLTRVTRGETLRSLISMPPRNLKTFAVSVAWVAWQLGLDPTRNFVCVSYSKELSQKFGRQCLAIMQSSWYRDLFPGTIISTARSAQHDFETTRGGGRLSTSITGTLTGRGGDVIIIDDPIKPDEAYSEVTRENVNLWYRSTLSSRLNNKASGAILVVMQRLHEDDLVGMLLKTGAWSHLKLAAIAQADEVIPIGRGRGYVRRAGEALHPERESLETLEGERVAMGSSAFNAQYLQDPLPAIGNIIKLEWLRTYDPSFDWRTSPGYIIQSLDTASKTGAHNDLSAFVTAHVDGRMVRVIHVFRARLEFTELKRHAIRLAREYSPKVLLIEDQASGTSLISTLLSEKPAGVPTPLRIHPEGDKLSRIMGVSAQIEAGELLLPADAAWLADFKAELLGFPNAPHDDQCDALSQLMNWVMLREAYHTAPTNAGPTLFELHDDGTVTMTGEDADDYVDDGDDIDPWALL